MAKPPGITTREVLYPGLTFEQAHDRKIDLDMQREENKMKKLLIPAVLIGVLISNSAFAHREWDDDYRPYWPRHTVIYQEPPVVVYQAPRVVYAPPPPPQVVYRERVVYRDVPTYSYQPPAPTYYQQQEYPRPSYQNGNHVAGQAIGAIAGGVIGNQIGRGGGRVVSTAVGAVLGAIAGDRIGY